MSYLDGALKNAEWINLRSAKEKLEAAGYTVTPPPEPKRHDLVRWVNCLIGASGDISLVPYKTREGADSDVDLLPNSRRIACKKMLITVIEGEGLE